MGFEAPLEQHKGRIRELILGGVRLGGENVFPFHTFEGQMPNLPAIAFEVWDAPPDDWSPVLVDLYGDVFGDTAAWIRRVVDDYEADLVYLRLKSADPNGRAEPVEQVIGRARALIEGAGVPVVVVGTGDADTDARLLRPAAEAFAGLPVALGDAEEANYRTVGAAAQGYGLPVVAYTPMDVNLAKQLNVLLSQLGVDEDRILMDPTTGALGYGLEYAYTVFERDRLAALALNDSKMQMPIIASVGQEAWKAKEARVPEPELPGTGELGVRAVLWEAITAVCLMLAGGNLLVLRHPEAARLVRLAIRSLEGEPSGPAAAGMRRE